MTSITLSTTNVKDLSNELSKISKVKFFLGLFKLFIMLWGLGDIMFQFRNKNKKTYTSTVISSDTFIIDIGKRLLDLGADVEVTEIQIPLQVGAALPIIAYAEPSAMFYHYIAHPKDSEPLPEDITELFTMLQQFWTNLTNSIEHEIKEFEVYQAVLGNLAETREKYNLSKHTCC